MKALTDFYRNKSGVLLSAYTLEQSQREISKGSTGPWLTLTHLNLAPFRNALQPS